jgi:NAD-dependent SIR2 family protein deacetylase
LDRYLNGLLALARPHLVHSGSRRPASLAADGLFGALMLQLLLEIHGSKGFVVCSGCSQIFVPLRRRSGQSAAYCPDCKGTRDNADRQARWRARQREASL